VIDDTFSQTRVACVSKNGIEIFMFTDERMVMRNLHDLMASISHLENIAKERLQRNAAANSERLSLLKQLTRYGICTCHCHFSTSVYIACHCCGNRYLGDFAPNDND
jgi:hypothetical protein